MMTVAEWKRALNAGKLDEKLKQLYGIDAAVMAHQKKRYTEALEEFAKLYPERKQVSIFSAPGRTEVGGNHTDHQHGCVLAAAVNLDVIAVVGFHSEKIIRLKSTGYAEIRVRLSDLSKKDAEVGTSTALIRGMAAKFAEMGAKLSGWDAYSTSDVLSGSGLSSSAAFEVLIGTIIDQHDNGGKAGAVEIAKIGQFAENVYFGKQSGLMDQMVSSVGGFVWIDFADTRKPVIRKHTFDFAKAGYCLCITDTKGSHADLTPDYVAVPTEMKQVAAYFGREVLRDVDAADFRQAIPKLRKSCSDRAILRAAHFFAENERATAEAKALENGDLSAFFALVKASGTSSWELLQNLYSCQKPEEQAIPLGIWYSQQFLGDKGAVRVHGGGFAGTIQAFVPTEEAEAYCRYMDDLFGKGSCHKLSVRPLGGVML